VSALSVLHVVPAVARRYGGPSAAVLGMCRALADAGVRPMMVTTDADGADHLAVPTRTLTTWEGVPAIFFESQGPDAFKWARGLGAWLRAHVGEYDIVHVHGVLSYSTLAAALACQHASVPYIMRPLGTLDPWSLRRHAWRKRLLMSIAGRRALAGASAIHFTSHDEEDRAREALRWLPSGVVVPLGVDDEVYADDRATETKDLPYVLAMSRLDPKKGIDALIRAFHEAAAHRPEWRLVIAGDGAPEYVESLRNLAEGGPAASRITFCGWVDGEARRTWLLGASVFALPSHQENFGIAVAQAMASGVAVLVTPTVALSRDILEAGAGWVCERDDLPGELDRILADRNSALIRGHLGRQYAERFRWPFVARALTEMYGAHTKGARTSAGNAAASAPVAAPVEGHR